MAGMARSASKQREREGEFFIRRKVKILARHLKFFEVEKCVRKNARARILSKSYNIFFSFFFVWKRNTKQLELLRSKKLQNTHTIYINILYGKVELQEELFLS